MVGVAAALGSAALWALGGVVLRDVAGRLSAFYITAIRTSVAALIALLIFAVVGPYDALIHMPSSTIALLLGTALLLSLGDTAFVRAMAFEDVSRVFTTSTGLYILASVSGSIVFAGEDFSVRLVIAGVAVLVGARLVVRRQAGAASPVVLRARQPMPALLLAIFAAILWSIGLLILADAMESIDALAANALRMPFTAVFLASIAGVRGEHRRQWKRQDLIPIFLNGALMAGATLLFLVAVKEGSVGGVAVLTSTSPIFAVPLAHFFLNERITLVTASGVTTCMIGVWLASV